MRKHPEAYSGIEDRWDEDEQHDQPGMSPVTVTAIIGAVLLLAVGYIVMGAVEAVARTIPRSRP